MAEPDKVTHILIVSSPALQREQWMRLLDCLRAQAPKGVHVMLIPGPTAANLLPLAGDVVAAPPAEGVAQGEVAHG